MQLLIFTFNPSPQDDYGVVIDMSNSLDQYDEPEGVFPDGKHMTFQLAKSTNFASWNWLWYLHHRSSVVSARRVRY